MGNRNVFEIAWKNRNLSKICLEKNRIICEIAWKNRGFRQFASKNRNLLDPDPRPPYFKLNWRRCCCLLRSAARLVLRERKFDHITDDLRDQLHWLSIRQRIQYKLGLLVYKMSTGRHADNYDLASRLRLPMSTIGRAWKSRCSLNTDSSHGYTELCCLWPNITELAASRIKNYPNPTGFF